VECGFSWLPTLLWRFDKDWKGVWREVPWLDAKPSEVVRRHLRLTTAPAHLPRDPAQVREALDLLDAANLLLHASDHPHDHGTGGERLLAALTDEERRRVLSGNAADWYRLGRWRDSPPPTSRPRPGRASGYAPRARARRWCCCTATRRPRPCGTSSRPSWPATTRWCSPACPATATAPPRPARASRPSGSGPWPPRSWRS